MSKRKICVVTGSRAEYGLLYWLMRLIDEDPELELQVIVTGMHLSPEFGLTYKVIEADGFTIDDKIEMLVSSDTPAGIAKSIGLGTIGFADAFARLKPDILILLGDRFEILAAAQAALVARIPLAHIGGGDITEGAFDEAIRHSITKMAHLHFVTNESSLKRVIQLGENPQYVFNVGNPGLDYIIRTDLLDKINLEKQLGFEFREKNLLITFHPATLDEISSSKQFQELLIALEKFDDVGLIFTKPNADTGGRKLIEILEYFTQKHENARVFASLGQVVYLSTINHVDAVVGNSSSGILEVPSFQKPTVNIGDRQKGRIMASSVINCRPQAEEIADAIIKAFELDCSNIVNPYGDGNASQKILNILKSVSNYENLLKKRFYEVNWSG